MTKALVFNCSPVKNGATAEICRIAEKVMGGKHRVTASCIADYSFAFCKGCRSCHSTAKCVLDDDIRRIMALFSEADVVLLVSPSYWADVPGQFKAFIDRCTPWCNTHEPHAVLPAGKKGYCITLRTGPNEKECRRLAETINHFYGHLEIEQAGSLYLTAVEKKDDVKAAEDRITAFCKTI